MKSVLKVLSIVLFVSIVSCKGKEKVVEKTTFDFVLVEAVTNKLAVVKLIKEKTGLGLKESKEIMDDAPKIVKSGISKEEAEKLKQAFEAVGAKVEIK
ncbi:MAG: ribosomal protein L7/L12 [Bacteroidetes bacterium]|nr:ribosomal protein L7/L12 [Bacteroidota bacterium]